jgi:hypothetical protein
VSVVRLIVATRSSGPPASGKIIKEMPGSVASGTTYITNVPACFGASAPSSISNLPEAGAEAPKHVGAFAI